MMSLNELLRPSTETFKIWRKKAQWIIYLDVAIASLCIIQIPMAIAGAVTWGNEYIILWAMLAPLVAAVLSILSLYFATRRKLSPALSLDQSLVMFVGWAGCITFITTQDLNMAYSVYLYEETDEAEAAGFIGPYNHGNAGVLWVGSICAIITVALYIPHIAMTCLAVNNHRRLKHDAFHQGATLNLDDMNPREDESIQPKGGRV